MNRIISLVVLSMICMVLPSCRKDKPDEPVNPSEDKTELLLIGEWSRKDNHVDSYRLVFLDNGKGYDKVMNSSGYDVDDTFTYSVKESTLKIYWTEYTETFTIVDINTKELILFNQGAYPEDVPDYNPYTYYTRI